MTPVTCAWRGEDDPSRMDRAVLQLGDLGMTGHGTSMTDEYSLSWRLDATGVDPAADDGSGPGRGWRTRVIEVAVHADGWSRALRLVRDARGSWSAEARSQGGRTLPQAGLHDPASLDDALDCDLGLCPVTNTMPIRRHALAEVGFGEPRDVHLAMAWVEVPSLRVVRSEQVYRAVSPGRVLYRSAGFQAELTVDEDGIVRDYPGLARRIDAH
jgi:hypothetical protein